MQSDFGERNLLLGDELIGDDSAPMPLDVALPAAEPRPTTGHVGRYALKECIGEGGLGRVSAAWDPILEREVAIKLLQLPEGSPAALGDLILNEARAVAALNHPGIVTVHDAGSCVQGPYIAMERLLGCDLRRLLADGWRPDAARAAKLARRIADALACAHAHGVVHCDIKPANIFMVDRRRPKLLDFGIARVARSGGAAGLRGLVTGSPYYLSPEQLRGQTADARSDIYALGVVFYELLTGRRPFEGDSLAAITDAVLDQAVPPAHALNPEVPESLSRIAARAMGRHPGERFPGAREMAHALRQWALRTDAGRASAPAAPTPLAPEPPRAGARWSDPRWRIAAAAASLVAVALTGAILWPGR